MSRRKRQLIGLFTVLVVYATVVVGPAVTVAVDTEIRREVNVDASPPVPVRASSIDCKPTVAAAHALISCEAEVDQSVDQLNWRTPEGEPERGSGLSWVTALGVAGEHEIVFEHCFRGICNELQSTVSVLGVPSVLVTCDPSPVGVGAEIACRAELSGDPADSIEWTVDGVTQSASDANSVFQVASRGLHRVGVSACNPVGCGEDEVQVTVVAAPRVDLVCPQADVAVNGAVRCSVTVSGDAADSIEWTTSSGGRQAGASMTYRTSFAKRGSESVTVSACNVAGCGGDRATVAVVDVPRVSLSCGEGAVAAGASVSCTATVAGDAAERFVWTASTGAGAAGVSSTYGTSFANRGSESIAVSACNVAGCGEDEVSLEVIEAPVAAVDCTPDQIVAGQSVSCSLRLSGDAADRITWSSSAGLEQVGGLAFTAVFRAPGNGTVEVMACNIAGCSEAADSVVVEAPPRLLVRPGAISFADPCQYSGSVVTSCPAAVSQTLTVSNGGGGTVSLRGAWFDGQVLTPINPRVLAVQVAPLPAPRAFAFAVDASGCAGRELAAGDSCRVVVTFFPSQVGDVTTVLNLSHTAASSAVRVGVSGAGSPIPVSIERFAVGTIVGECQTFGRMWVQVSFRVDGDPGGRIELWWRELDEDSLIPLTAFIPLSGYSTIGVSRLVTPSQDDGETWEYELRARNGAGSWVFSRREVAVGTGQCSPLE